MSGQLATSARTDEPSLSTTRRRHSVSVRRITVAHRRLVAKVATGRSRAALRTEAQLLQQIGLDLTVGLVALREHDDRTDLILDDAGTHSLAETAHLGLHERLEALQRCASAVHQLHQRGWSHGALCAEHVVVDPGDGVRLCSLGSARPCGPDDPERRADHAQLLEIVRGLAGSTRPADCSALRWWQTRRAIQRQVLGPEPPADPAELADRLSRMSSRSGRHGHSPPRRTAAEVRPHGGHRRPSVRLRERLAPLAVPGIGAAAVAAILVAGGAVAPDRTPARADRVEPIVDDVRDDVLDDCAPGGSCLPTRIEGNVVEVAGHRYRVGEAGDRPAVAAHCPDGAVVYALRPSTGQIVRFDRLAEPGTDLRGRPVAQVDGATDLVVDEAPDCRTLRVRRSDGSVLVVADTAAGEAPS